MLSDRLPIKSDLAAMCLLDNEQSLFSFSWLSKKQI